MRDLCAAFGTPVERDGTNLVVDLA